jgi:hypothetical protein
LPSAFGTAATGTRAARVCGTSRVLTFLHDATVPPTNNASERSLRPSVVHRKVTGGFRSEAFAQGYAALRTVADTARKRGHALFALLLRAAEPRLPSMTQYAITHP